MYRLPTHRALFQIGRSRISTLDVGRNDYPHTTIDFMKHTGGDAICMGHRKKQQMSNESLGINRDRLKALWTVE